ncbi:hypothetical protein MHU86_11786 [Fragilaria crotonensis]|nr:hypothetical protein MHU86_11786 [Fragilaria crotonensis]
MVKGDKKKKKVKSHKARDVKDTSNSSSAKHPVPTKATTTLGTTSVTAARIKPRHNFTTNALDHCETPRVAYEHIRDVLLRLFGSDHGRGDMTSTIKIWDPYYCDGAVQRHLIALGFPNVLNENKDFYKLIETNQIPDHDVFLTNPPYSDDHIERLLTFLNKTPMNHKDDDGNDDGDDLSSCKPFCLLLPNWVARKREYKTLMSNRTVFYLSPIQPYTYVMPAWNGRDDNTNNNNNDEPAKNTDVDGGTNKSGRPDHVGDDGLTTPYLSSWYISAGSNLKTEALLQQLQQVTSSSSSKNGRNEWVVAKTIKGLKWKIQKQTQR